MTFNRNRRFVAAIVAAACTAVPAAASASAGLLPPTYQSDAAQSGTDGKTNSSIQPETGSSIQPQTGSSIQPHTSGKRESTFPATDIRGGDTPADHPGASDAKDTAARAQERYYSSHGEPEPLAVPQSPAPSDDTPWLPIALSITGALVIVAASATQLRRFRFRRRRAVRSTA